MSGGEELKEYFLSIDPSVYDRMFHHVMFLAEVSQPAALRLEERLYDGMKSLMTLPHRNPLYENQFATPGKYRSLLVGKHHRIVYTVEGETVCVDNIIDCRQDG